MTDPTNQHGQPSQPVPQQPGLPPQAYGQQGYGQPVYQQTVVYAPYPPQPRGLSITSLVLGIASVVFGFTFLVPIGAIVFGAIGIKREPTGKGMSITGLICGSVCLLGWIVAIVIWVVILVSVVGAASTYGSYHG